MLLFLFTTLKRCLETEDTEWQSVSGAILCHSSCKQVLRCATVQGPRCHILHHTFSFGDRFGLQAGRSSTCTLFFFCHAFVMCAEMWFCISLLKYAQASLEKSLSWRQWMLLKNLDVLFLALVVASQKCKLPLPRALTQTHTMTDTGIWTYCW